MSRYILGISAQFHDAAAALVCDGNVVAAAAEERFSRIKHDAAFPRRAAKWCLESHNLRPDDLEYVVFHEKPLWKFERLIITQLQHFPRSFGAFRRTALGWLTDKLWIRNTIANELGVDTRKIIFCNHHLSHAASAFYTSDFTTAAVLTVDGVGEWASTALFAASEKGLERLEEIRFPHSIGLVYSAFTAYLGFEVNDGEAKVMGLASYGQPRFRDEIRRILRGRQDGSFDVDLSYVTYHYSAIESYSRKLETLLGPARKPDAPLDMQTAEGRRLADIAASIQAVTEDCLVDLANALHKRTGARDLCFAGGVALNSVANYHLLKRTPFQRIFVHPAAGDDGCAVGAALWAWNEVLRAPRGAALCNAGLGKSWSDGDIAKVLDDLGVKHDELDDDQLVDRATADLTHGKALGWFQGRFEWGPRALGYRSILADARQAGMNDHINRKIKFREEFRPFAPAVSAGSEDRYFDLPPGSGLITPWMLLVVPVLPYGAEMLPATTHVDRTARPQVVAETANPLFHRLLSNFGAATGHPVLLNTSFNLKGEPIVASPLHALRTFFSSDLDVLYLGRFRVLNTDADKRNQRWPSRAA